MDMLKHVLSIKRFARFIVLAAIVVMAIAGAFLDQQQILAVLAGYSLFAANVWVLAYLAGLVFNIMSGASSQTPTKSQGFVLMLAASKMMFLFFALYVFIGVLKLSGLYIFVGSLTALVLLSTWMSITYLKFLSNSAMKKNGSGDTETVSAQNTN